MPRPRFVATIDLPDDAATASGLVVSVGNGTVAVVDGVADESAVFVGVLDGRPVWGVDVDGPLDGGIDLRFLYGRLDEVTWTVAGRAVQLVEWQRTHRFCGRCATPTQPAARERARRCPACGLMAFPRLAPAVIVLVEDGAGRALLGRGRGWPFYSCLAGFVEPGETLEEAVVREVAEEVGVAVADVRYCGSQPWPFPHSLMIGFTARWTGGEITPDGVEIEDAGWFEPHSLPVIPPSLSIANRIINDWVARSS